MPKALDPQERYRRARAALDAARAELATLPPTGRERTYAIARARKHCLAARNVLGPLLRRRPGQSADNTAQQLAAEADRLWPASDAGRR